mmetsp:Transcript_49287/g.136673  ORF Transcript_49287/g.136673 Transcript_49287/m.136673 type:complete len:81 (+) Transcript_49287:195-437(+)
MGLQGKGERSRGGGGGGGGGGGAAAAIEKKGRPRRTPPLVALPEPLVPQRMSGCGSSISPNVFSPLYIMYMKPSSSLCCS